MSKASNRKALFKMMWRMRMLYLFLLIPFVFMVIWDYGPMYGVIIAFKDFRYGDGIMGSPFNNFEHFKFLFRDILFQRAFFNTLRISFTRILITFPAPIVFALMLNELRSLKFKRFVQTVSYLPHFMSWVIVSGFVYLLLSPEVGVVNAIRSFFGAEPIFFMGKKPYFITILMSSLLWKGIGWSSIIYLAAMASINLELYESAELDGANRFHKAWHITLPGIAPIVTIQFILTLGNIMKGGFDPIFNLYNGLTMEVADVIETFSFRAGIVGAKYDYAAAIGLFQNVIGLALVLSVNWVVKRISEYAIW